MNKKRVVITGIGAISPIGNNIEQIDESLKKGKSGISFQQEYKDIGMRSNIAGSIDKENISYLVDCITGEGI